MSITTTSIGVAILAGVAFAQLHHFRAVLSRGFHFGNHPEKEIRHQHPKKDTSGIR